ncbi:MAG: flavodoxin family protein [Firmicutes bacterium]|nr:flavodoxin family protein [Bacillota bacterium]
MKITAIIASARKKGNTYKVVRQIEDIIKADYPDTDFIYYYPSEHDTNFCKGCTICITKGEHLCPHYQTVDELEKLITESDGVILASPVYVMQVSALMKNLLDHFAYRWHRPKFFNQRVITVATSAAAGFVGKDTVGYMELCAKNMGMIPSGKINVIGDEFPQSEQVRKKEESQIRKVTGAFISSLKNGKLPKPSIKDLFWFRIWQTTTRIGEKEKMADFRYWSEKGWYNSDYYYPASIDPVTGTVLKAFGAMVRNSFRHSFENHQEKTK